MQSLAQKYADNAVDTLIKSGAVPYVPYPWKHTQIFDHTITYTDWTDLKLGKVESIVAPYNGWYTLYISLTVNDAGGQTRAAYIQVDGSELARNAEYGGGRDFSVGPVYAPKGATIGYGSVYCKNVSMNCIHSAKD